MANLVYLDAQRPSELEQYHGKLHGAIVLVGAIRELQARFDPLATRVSDSDLLRLADAGQGSAAPPGIARMMTPSERQAMLADTPAGRMFRRRARPSTGPSTGPATRPTTRPLSPGRIVDFLLKEGATAMLSPSTQGDGGTIFVAFASLPGQDFERGQRPRNAPRPWSVDAPKTIPQIIVAVEQYNRMVSMIQQGERLSMALDLQVQFHQDDLMARNTIAEVPGTDLKDEVVMLGAHMDSWQSGTGATDNGAGCGAVMEAVRIIRALGLHPRRTIRVALWTGEEEGLLGSRAYVAKHFGAWDPPEDWPSRPRSPQDTPTTQPASSPTTQMARRLVKKGEYEQLSVYFNLDNGTGKIRGVYLQGNESARPLFRQWLAPFVDLNAATLTLSNTGGTDHTSFDVIGLPGFQFIQDPIDYSTRTHHSNQDVFDRIQSDDLKQAATILAAIAYNAAMTDERFPRKALAQVAR